MVKALLRRTLFPGGTSPQPRAPLSEWMNAKHLHIMPVFLANPRVAPGTDTSSGGSNSIFCLLVADPLTAVEADRSNERNNDPPVVSSSHHESPPSI